MIESRKIQAGKTYRLKGGHVVNVVKRSGRGRNDCVLVNGPDTMHYERTKAFAYKVETEVQQPDNG